MRAVTGRAAVAPTKPADQMASTRTRAPVWGASTIVALPTTIPTWSTVVGELPKNTRSPGTSPAVGDTTGPASYCAWATRGKEMPAAAKAAWTRPEQSKPAGPSPPQRYGVPTRASAHATATSAASDGWGAAGAPASPGTPTPTAARPEPSDVTAAPASTVTLSEAVARAPPAKARTRQGGRHGRVLRAVRGAVGAPAIRGTK